MHLVESAARLKLPPSTKLAFMAFCDSADRETGIALPGQEQILEWAGVGKSRSHEIINELVELGYLARVREGRRGRRAEYRVYDKIACCPLHDPFGSTPPDKSTPPDPNLGSGPPDKYRTVPEKLGSGPPDKSTPPDPNGEVRVRLGSTPDRTPSQLLKEPPLRGGDADASNVVDMFEDQSPPQTTKSKTTRAKAKIPIPDDWDLTEGLTEWARTETDAPSLQWLRDQAATFIADAGANDRRHSNWDLAFQVWIRRELKWQAERGGGRTRRTAPAPVPYFPGQGMFS
jgi:hypothetical protein